MENILKDIRYGIRGLLRQPGFTLIAVATLAVSIGANTAIFSVVNATLLRPLPFKDPNQLVMVWQTNQQNQTSVAEPNFLDYQQDNHVFDHMAAFNGANLTLTGGPDPERLRGGRVTADFFNVLGTQAFMGHTFLPKDDQPGNNTVVVLSYGLWQRRFGSDKNIVGQTIQLDSKPYTVIGVLPADFEFSIPTYFAPAQLFVPIVLRRDNEQRSNAYMRVIARLKPGATAEQAQAELGSIAQRIATQYPEVGGLGIKVISLREQIVGNIRHILLLLMGAVGFVLLIACANVANLQLVRASARQKEFAIRAALGAGRARVTQQLLIESLLLSMVGAVLGVGFAWIGIKLVSMSAPGQLATSASGGIDVMVLLYTLLISVVTGVLAGLAPSFHTSTTWLIETLKEGGRNPGANTSGRRIRNALTVAEIALSLVLLIGAGLLLRSFQSLLDVKPGFESKNVLTLRLSLPRYSYPDVSRQSTFYSQMLERVGTLPGVKAVGGINDLPLTADRDSSNIAIEGNPVSDVSQLPTAEVRSVTPRYFEAMSIPLIEGRGFGNEDSDSAPPVVIVNQTLVRRFFPNESPVGRRIMLEAATPNSPWMTIVGVVGDVRDLGLEKHPDLEVYQPYQQQTLSYMNLVARTEGDPRNLAGSIRNEIRTLDKSLPLAVPEPMEKIVAASVEARRFNLTLLGVFAGLALFLAAVGIYGVMSYGVTQRTQEIGVRMALGATPVTILKLILRKGIMLAGTGIIVGLVGALALTRLMTSLLYGVTATDTLTFAGVSITMLLVAMAASYLPARRATKIDPLDALRNV